MSHAGMVSEFWMVVDAGLPRPGLTDAQSVAHDEQSAAQLIADRTRRAREAGQPVQALRAVRVAAAAGHALTLTRSTTMYDAQGNKKYMDWFGFACLCGEATPDAQQFSDRDLALRSGARHLLATAAGPSYPDEPADPPAGRPSAPVADTSVADIPVAGVPPQARTALVDAHDGRGPVDGWQLVLRPDRPVRELLTPLRKVLYGLRDQLGAQVNVVRGPGCVGLAAKAGFAVSDWVPVLAVAARQLADAGALAEA